jgi:hypothetical protein
MKRRTFVAGSVFCRMAPTFPQNRDRRRGFDSTSRQRPAA